MLASYYCSNQVAGTGAETLPVAQMVAHGLLQSRSPTMLGRNTLASAMVPVP